MDTTFVRRARRHTSRASALVVATLVAAGLALAPTSASAGALAGAALPLDPVLDPVLAPLDPVVGPLDPVLTQVLVDPDLSGAGTVTGAGGGLSCTNATSGTVGCTDPLTLGDLGGTVTGVVLTAAPATGWQFAGWSGACTGSSTSCSLSADALTGALAGTPLAPGATFVPVDGGAEPNPLCDSPTGPPPTVDCQPPVTVLKTKPAVKPTSNTSDGAGVTKQTGATFTFTAMEPKPDGTASTTPTPGATFACRLLKKPATTGDFAACPGTTPGTASYSGLTDGTYEFAVRATDAEDNTDATPETFTWTIDTTAPETVLTAPAKFWILARTAAFGHNVVAPDVAADVTFQCHLDGAGRPCGTVTFAPGTHTFKAAATDKAGNTDTTPASRSFTMPLNNKDLRHSRGWTQAKIPGTFLNTASLSTKKGAKLSADGTKITRIALVASKGKGHGNVSVLLGKKVLKTVKLAHSRNVKKKLIEIASFPVPVSGKVTVVVASQGKKVVIEGLGIATR